MYYLTSMRRHVLEQHKYDMTSSNTERDNIREEVLDNELLEVQGDSSRPITTCIAKFKFESSKINHLRLVHSMEVEDVNRFNETVPMRDTLDEPVRCPKCPTSVTRFWSRRSKLLRHLESKIHGLTKEAANDIVNGRKVSEDPKDNEDLDDDKDDDDEDDDRVDNDDDPVDNIPLVDESTCGVPLSLTFLDKFRRRCRCHLCPLATSIRLTTLIAEHLERDHRIEIADVNKLISVMDKTTHTEGGEKLEDYRAGLGLGLDVELTHGPVATPKSTPAPVAAPESTPRPAPSSSRAPIGEKAVCPVCQTEFSRKQSVVNHLKRTHKFGPERVKQYTALIKSVQKECTVHQVRKVG